MAQAGLYGSEWEQFYSWLVNTYGYAAVAYAGGIADQINIDGKEGGPDWWRNDYWNYWRSQGRPESSAQDLNVPGGPPNQQETPPTYEEIIGSSVDDSTKYNLISQYFPNQIQAWLSSEGLYWLMSQPYKNGVWTLPDGSTWTTNELGQLQKAGEEIPSPSQGRSQVAPGVFQNPDGSFENDNGDPIPDATAQAIIDNYMKGLETPEEPNLGIPPGYTIDQATGYLKDSDGNLFYQNPDTGQLIPVSPEMPADKKDIIPSGDVGLPEGGFGYYDDNGVWQWIIAPNETPEAIPPMPSESPPAGYHWEFDSSRNQWVAQPGELPSDAPPFPTDPPPAGYHWEYNPSINEWTAEPGTIPSSELPPYPTEAPPAGYHWEYNPSTGNWEPVLGETGPNLPNNAQVVVPGMLWQDPETGQYYDQNGYAVDAATAQGMIDDWMGRNEVPMTEYQKENLALQEQQLALEEARLRQEGKNAEADRALAYRQMLSQMLAKPASWLEYAAASNTQAAIQPWMLPLSRGDYNIPGVGDIQLQAGAPLPGWGPDWASYYGGTPGGVTGGTGGTTEGRVLQSIPPTGPTAEQMNAIGGWEQVQGGYNQTGGLSYDPERERIISQRYNSIYTELQSQYPGMSMNTLVPLPPGYPAAPGQSQITLGALLQYEAERQARDWYNQTYGEEYPVYPGQEQVAPTAALPPIEQPLVEQPPVEQPPTEAPVNVPYPEDPEFQDMETASFKTNRVNPWTNWNNATIRRY